MAETRKPFSELAGFFPKQQLALEATKSYRYVLYGGSLGSGKSRWLRWICVYWLLTWAARGYRGVRVGLFCEDYPALNDRHIGRVRSEFPEWLGDFNEQRHEFTLKPRFGSGVIAFRNLDDPSKYLSTEFALVAVDEVNRNPYQTFLELRKRLRWPGIDDVRMAFACNPVGEAWVKRYWVDRIFPPEEGERDQFFYVRALPTDNPHLPASYFDNLKSLPERERRAYLDGDWEAFETLRDQDGWYKLLTSTEVESASVDQSDGRFGHAGATFIGLDPGGGGDRSGAVVRSDVLAEVLLDERTNDTMSMVPMVVSWCQARKVDAVVVDLGGLGKPIYDRLCEVQGSLNGAEIIGVQMSGRPSDAMRYRDLKSEMLIGARGWVLGGGRLSRSHSWNELTVCRYRPDSDQRYRVMGKDEMLRGGVESPNVAEALAYTFAPQCATMSMRMHQTGLADRYREQAEQERFGFVQQP